MNHTTLAEIAPRPTTEAYTPTPAAPTGNYNHSLEAGAAVEQTETTAVTLEVPDRGDLPEYAIGDPGLLVIAGVGTALAVSLFWLTVDRMPKNEN